ncbi:transglycosylase SLT domain-containing protein [Nocardia sp. CWNU-33]|uniref:transglycosylase SLT domain-containing protein n=1 Tax=Nocardia sp. CWNU-33 TaxID=3392117 RepID=UPI00398E8F16
MTAKAKRWMPEGIEPPAGATAGLIEVVTTARVVIQTSADQLATGSSADPPNLMKLLSDKKLVDTQNKSVMVDSYSSRLDEVRAIKSDIKKQDEGIDMSSYGVFDVSSQTFTSIKDEAKGLANVLAAAPALREKQEYLTASQEAPLITAALNASESVRKKVEGANKQVDDHKKEIEKATSTYASKPGYVPSYSGRSGGGRRGSSYGPYRAPSASDYAKYTGTTTVNQAIEGALDALGITDPVARENWRKGYLVLIERESSNNPNAINLEDSNADAGHPSEGLAQCIPSTFRENHVPGTSNFIRDPVANVAASMNYVMRTYGVSRDGSNLAAEVPQANPAVAGHGY